MAKNIGKKSATIGRTSRINMKNDKEEEKT